MKRVCFLLALWGGQLSAVTESEVIEAEIEARRIVRSVEKVRDENRALEARQMALSTTADLIAGRRETPPPKRLVATEVLRLCEKAVTVDNRATGKPGVFKKGLTLKGGRRYRVQAQIEIREITDTKSFKFGMMVQKKGRPTQWPSANVGGQPMSEREVGFDFFCPEGATCLLLVGFETGKGVAVIRDVHVSEIAEALR